MGNNLVPYLVLKDNEWDVQPEEGQQILLPSPSPDVCDRGQEVRDWGVHPWADQGAGGGPK